MGRSKQQRRAAKTRRRQRASARRPAERARTGGAGTGSRGTRAGGPASDASAHGSAAGDVPRNDGFTEEELPPLSGLVRAGAWAWGRDPVQDEATARTLDRLGEPALAAAGALLAETVAGLWTRGWTPADVVQATRRLGSPAHAARVAATVVADGRVRTERGERLHPRWVDQLGVLDGDGSAGTPLDGGVRLCLELLSLLIRLPDVAQTVPPPGQQGTGPLHAAGLDARMLARVRALLAKAESTEFEDEAEALTAKAQELIARHAIDEALLHTVADVGEPSRRRVMIDNPYADAKAALLDSVAKANRCRCVYSPDLGWVTVFGYDADLDAVELLNASLLAQATSGMARHGSRRDAYGRVRTRSFRRAFLYAFAVRIGQRLRAATDGQVGAATDDDRGRALPVLAARDDRLRAAVEDAFPRVARSRSASLNNADGWVAGTAAADQAHLGVPAGALRRPLG